MKIFGKAINITGEIITIIGKPPTSNPQPKT